MSGKIVAALGFALALSACVSNSPTPSIDLISQAQSQLQEEQLSLAATPAADDGTATPSTVSALSQAQTPTPSEAAAGLALNDTTSVGSAEAPPLVASLDQPPVTPPNGDVPAGSIANSATALAPAPAKKASFFDRLFGQSSKARPAANVGNTNVAAASSAPANRTDQQVALAETADAVNRPNLVAAVPKVAPKRVSAAKKKEVASRITATEALPGVKKKRGLFDTIFGTGDDDRSDAGPNSAPVQVASVGGFARIAPNGLLRQHAGVRVKCIKPRLLRLLRNVERRYGKKVIVTSGYRSPKANRRAGGARNSMHIYCSAVDIQVPGISKWRLAKYLRSMPGRGGVGTYCHTKSVHIDIGKQRDWNHRCRKRKRRRG